MIEGFGMGVRRGRRRGGEGGGGHKRSCSSTISEVKVLFDLCEIGGGGGETEQVRH